MSYPLVHKGKPIGRADTGANVVRLGRFLRTEYLAPDNYVTIGDLEGEHRPAELDESTIRRLEDDPEPDDASHLTAHEVGLPATY